MSATRHLPPGYVIAHPNRELRSSHVAKAVVVAVLLLSVAVILAITLGGWNRLDGMTPVSFAWCLVYAVIAFYVWRWARGLLPIAATLAMLLLVPAVVALSGIDGTTWSERAGAGYGQVHTLFGGSFSPHLLSLLTILLIPIQLALIAVCVQAFMQNWNIELEVPGSEVTGSGVPGSGVPGSGVKGARPGGRARPVASAPARGARRR